MDQGWSRIQVAIWHGQRFAERAKSLLVAGGGVESIRSHDVGYRVAQYEFACAKVSVYSGADVFVWTEEFVGFGRYQLQSLGW